jgi:hypothetical protein
MVRQFLLLATKGVVIGNNIGGVTVVDDDPVPIITAVAGNVTVVEGQLLHWTLQLSVPTNGLLVYLVALPTITGEELRSDDVDQDWLKQNSYAVAAEPQPLSNLLVRIAVYIPPGEMSVEVVVPIVIDNRAEPLESILLMLYNEIQNPLQPDLFLTGNVISH